mgnify:CR=1 FL=1
MSVERSFKIQIGGVSIHHIVPILAAAPSKIRMDVCVVLLYNDTGGRCSSADLITVKNPAMSSSDTRTSCARFICSCNNYGIQFVKRFYNSSRIHRISSPLSSGIKSDAKSAKVA